LFMLYYATMGGTIVMIHFGGGFDGTADAWSILGLALLTALAGIGMMYTWSVALISPPSSNRVLIVRLYTLAAWLVTGLACWVITENFRSSADREEGLILWMNLAGLLVGLSIGIAIHEREHWGMRVARTIPRAPLLRLLAFPLYSGAAGGILFSLLLAVFT